MALAPPRPPERGIETGPVGTPVQAAPPPPCLVVGLVLLGAAAAEAQTERILVSNTAVGNDDTANTSGNDHAQLFHTGGHTGGYTLTKVRVNSEDDEGDDFDVEVCEEDGSADEFPSTTASDCTALTAPSDFTAGLVLFTHAGLAPLGEHQLRGGDQAARHRERAVPVHHQHRRRYVARPLGVEHQRQVLLEERQYLDD